MFIICNNYNNYGQETDTFKKRKQNVNWKKIYIGLDLGGGWLKASPESIKNEHSSSFIVGFCAGYIPLEWLHVGLLFNVTDGIYKEYENDSAFQFDNPYESTAITNWFAQIQFFPFKKFNFLINLEGGIIDYYHSPKSDYIFNSSGLGYKLGLGYEFKVYKELKLSIVMKYGAGKFNKDYYDPVNDIYSNKPSYTIFDIPLRILYYF